MKMTFETALHLATAAVSAAAPLTLDPVSAGLVLAAISLGFALKARR